MPGHQNLLSGFSWSPSAATPRIVTFSFAAEGPASGWAPFSPAQQVSARAALALWDAASGVSFREVPDAPGGIGSDIRFRLENLPLATFGLGAPPGVAPEAGDVVLNLRLFANDPLAPHPTRVSFELLLHEIGHAIGLRHPEAGDAAPLASLPTVMVPEAGARLPTNALGAWDVAAAQALYGTPADEAAAFGLPPPAAPAAVAGGAGDDLLAPPPGAGLVEGGPGFDTLLVPALRANARLDLHAETLSWDGGSLRFAGVERVAFADGLLVLAGGDPGVRIVQQAYRDILRREPDPTGLGHWAERVAEGMGEAELRARLAASAEFAAGVADRPPPPAEAAGLAPGPLWVPDFEALVVARLYHLALGRRPEEAGLRHWVARMEGGEGLEAVAWGFLQSPEARARGGAVPFATAAELVAAAHDEARIAPLAPWTDSGIVLF